ncbi:MAG: hypothetical protein A2277_21600 [Desulfobacterales bacterium RIFOXYA12_FULL_46_15]|nr:MAG: hypothetical protein A2277_21600 [Desulfobacterales bacterium RIFOXYA12_FULL_46_15]
MKDQPVSGHLTTIFIAPPIVVLTLVFLFISLLTRQVQMAVLILMVLGLMMLTKFWSRHGFSKMEFEYEPDKTRVFPGERIRVEILTQNNKVLPVWICAEVADDGSGLVFENRSPETGFLLWFQEMRFVFDLMAVKRGCFNMGRVHITVSDLFRFFPRERVKKDATDIIVFPKIFPVRSFSLPEHGFFGVPGARSPVSDPVYILGTRDYQSFTPVRHIHWKASARQAKLKEKVCEPSVQEKILIVVDVDLFFSHGAGEDFERMLEAVASMAVYFENRGYAVGFMTNAVIKGDKPGFIPLGCNVETLSRILETLARMEMRPQKRLAKVFARHISVLWGINCIFGSHSMDSSMLEMKKFYAAKRIPVKYFVSKMRDMGEDTERRMPGAVQPVESIFL